jgi:hypothetical protein
MTCYLILIFTNGLNKIIHINIKGKGRIINGVLHSCDYPSYSPPIPSTNICWPFAMHQIQEQGEKSSPTWNVMENEGKYNKNKVACHLHDISNY